MNPKQVLKPCLSLINQPKETKMRTAIENKKAKLQEKLAKIQREKVQPIINEIAVLDKMLDALDEHTKTTIG